MNNKYKILLVDDEPNFLRSLKDTLELEDYVVFTAKDGLQAVQFLETQKVDVVVSDIRMPKMDGKKLLQHISNSWPQILVFLLTGYGSIKDAVDCVKMGATNYILKPINVQDLIENIQQSLSEKSDQTIYTIDENLIGESEQIKNIRSLIYKIAGSDLSVLITGESGTGKEMVANSIYQNSDRKNRPFVKINCASLPEHLLESELFGYEPGAFTDAKKLKRGKFELVHSGTLFLDEIGDMPVSMQAKLLRVLEEKKVERLGGNRLIETDFRLISATNQNLELLIEQGKFREDLYYRLNMIQIQLPGLREIAEDISRLCQFFLEKFAQNQNKKCPQIHPVTKEKLLQYSWPGNVRELKNVIHRAFVLSEGKQILPENLPASILSGKNAPQNKSGNIIPLVDLEKEHIANILKLTGGNKNRTASILNIHRDTLYRKIKKYNIEVH